MRSRRGFERRTRNVEKVLPIVGLSLFSFFGGNGSWEFARPAYAAGTSATTEGTTSEATTLFYEARTLMARGKYGDACPKLERSLAIDPGIGTQFNLANCYEHVGKIASAWLDFDDVAKRAKEAGQAERERIAKSRAKDLEARLPKMVVDVGPTPASNLEIRRDGVLVPRDAWGTPLPVDPGVHTLTATAPNKEPWETSFVAVEAKIRTIAIPQRVAAQPPATSATMPAAPAVTPAPVPIVPPASPIEEPAPATSSQAMTSTTAADFPEPVVETSGSTQKTLGFVIGGAGILSLGTSVGFGIRSLQKHDDARVHCSGNLCNAQGVELRNEARTAGNVATITAIAGGAALVTGIVLVLTAPRGQAPLAGSSKQEPRSVASITPDLMVGRDGATFVIRGALP